MARPTAWLEKKRGRFAIRYRDPDKVKPDGSPIYRLKMIDPPAMSKAAAMPSLEAFRARLPAPRSQCRAGFQPMSRMTIMRIALEWQAKHPMHRTRLTYCAHIQDLVGAAEGMGVEFPADLTAQRIDDFKLAKGYKGVHRRLAYLRSVLQWAADTKLMEPLDPSVMKALSAPQSKKARKAAMSMEQYEAMMRRAAHAGPHVHALMHCLALYGWRPLTACRITVGQVDLADAWIVMEAKDVSQAKDKDPVEHPLLQESIDLLRPLVEGRHPTERLFLNQFGKPWKCGDSAHQVTNWYGANLRKIAPEAGGTNALKRFACWRMRKGIAPWSEPLDDSEIIRFTGHDDEEMVSRYRVTDREYLRRLAGGARRETVRAQSVDDLPIVIEEVRVGPPPAVVDGGGSYGLGLTEADVAMSFTTQFCLQPRRN